MDTGNFFVSSRITHVIGCGSSESNIAEKEENKKFSLVGLGVDAYNRRQDLIAQLLCLHHQ